MAEQKFRAVAQIFLDTKDAAKDANQFVRDIKRKLNDIESAADKVTVFKDFVGYISQIDKALAVLKAKNADAFKHMFDGLDAGLKEQLESIFGVSDKSLGKLDVLREKLETLTPKSGIATIRKFAEEINGIFAEAGQDIPFKNIDEQFKGRATKQHIADLTKEVINFAKIWDGVASNVGKGFGFGGSGGSGGGAGISKISKEIQTEIDKLEQQKNRYESIIDKFNEVSKMKLAFDEGNKIALDFEATEEAAQELIEKFYKLNDALAEGKLNDIEYADTIAERAKAVLQLEELRDHLTKRDQQGNVTKAAPDFLRKFFAADANGDILSEYALEDFEFEAADAVEKVNQEIQLTIQKMTELRESAKNASDSSEEFGDGVTGAMNGAGAAIDKTKQKVVEVSEYIKGISAQLQNMFNVFSKPMDVEYRILMNGQEINVQKGMLGEVDALSDAKAFLSNLGKGTDLDIHSHMGRNYATNPNDIANAIKNQYLGMSKLSAIIGDTGIMTLDFASLDMKDATKGLGELEKLFKSTGGAAFTAEQINKIFGAIKSGAVVAREWSPGSFDDLAKFIYFIGQSSEESIAPLERFKKVLTYFSKDIDFNKYERLLSTFREEKAGSIFNQIMKSEGIDLQVDTLKSGSISDVISDLEAQQEATRKLRNESKITYGELEKIVSEYYATFTQKSKAHADFFNRYFTTDERLNLNQMFAGIEFGERDLTGVTKTIASYFNIDPDDMISSAGIDQAKVKLQEFLSLSEETRNKSFAQNWDATDNIEIGKYTQRLEEARNALRELGQQGLLTSEELEAVEDAFTSASTHLKIETNTSYSHGGGGGYYYESYESEYEDAKNANQKLKDQLDIMRQLSEIDKQVGLTYDYQVDELDHLIEKRKELLNLAEQDDSLNEEDLAAQRAITAEYEARSNFIKEGYDKAFDDFYKELNYLNSEDLGKMDLDTIDGYINRLNSLHSTLSEARDNYLLGDGDGSTFDYIEQHYRESMSTLNEARSELFASKGSTNVDEQNMQLREQLEIKQQIATTDSKLDDGQKNIQTSAEYAQLELLEQKLREVKAAVDAKTQAFEEEYVTVDGAVEAEIASLESLINQLKQVAIQVGIISDGFSAINTNTPNIETGAKLTEQNINVDENLSTEITQLGTLQSTLADVKNAIIAKTKAFVDEGNVVGQAIGKEIAALKQLSGIVDEITPKINSLVSGLTAIQNSKDIIGAVSGDTTQEDAQPTRSPADQFKVDVATQKGNLTKYIDSLKDVDYVSDATRQSLISLRQELDNIDTSEGLDRIVKQFKDLKNSIDIEKGIFEHGQISHIDDYKNKLHGSWNKLTYEQQNQMLPDYDKAIAELGRYKLAVKDGKKVELDAINEVTAALMKQMEAYQQINKEAQKKSTKFGNTAMINATAKYNSLSQTASMDMFANSSQVQDALAAYKQAYQIVEKMQVELGSKDKRTLVDEAAFKEATNACNQYAKSLEKLISNSLKLHNEKANNDDYILGTDFKDDISGRKEALADFAQQMYGVSLAATDFKDNFNKAVFAVDNGDGTFTQMTAQFTDARNEIVALAGDTKKVQSAFSSFIDGFKGRVKSLAQYFLATISIYDVWRVVKQGVTYVQEIDLALTELRKVTNQTEAEYREFLQTMSQTANVTGSTVKDLTSSAADWARLNI